MTQLDDLKKAHDEITVRAKSIRSDQWGLPTPCEKWTVRHLVTHVVEGSNMAVLLLQGASAEESLQVFGVDHHDLVAELEAALAREAEAFATPGAFEMTVHHPGAGDLPGAVFCGFRTGDCLLHSWDLARATGADESLPGDLVQTIWESLQPLAPVIGTLGVFGEGPSGNVGEDASLQARLLDLTGRRP